MTAYIIALTLLLLIGLRPAYRWLNQHTCLWAFDRGFYFDLSWPLTMPERRSRGWDIPNEMRGHYRTLFTNPQSMNLIHGKA